MITALGAKAKIWVYAVLIVLGYGIVFLISCHIPATMNEWAKALPKALGVAVSISPIVGHRCVINFVWKRIPILNRIVAPNLNGTYQLKNSSNWPVKKRMLDALSGVPAKADSADNPLLEVVGKLIVQMSLFRLQIKYIPSEQIASRSSSEVLSASFHPSHLADTYELSYLYLATVISPIGDTDEQHYYGSAHLRLPAESKVPKTLTGKYWTNRMWMKGLNTAGEVLATRI